MPVPRSDDEYWIEQLPLAEVVLKHERDRDIYRLFYLQQLNYWQISERLGCARSTVGLALNRARRQLATAAVEEKEGKLKFGHTLQDGHEAHFEEDETQKTAFRHLEKDRARRAGVKYFQRPLDSRTVPALI